MTDTDQAKAALQTIGALAWELTLSASVAIQEMIASAPWGGEQASADVLRAAAELRTNSTRMREELIKQNIPSTGVEGPKTSGETTEMTAIELEKKMCEALGKSWQPAGMSVVTLVDELIGKLKGYKLPNAFPDGITANCSEVVFVPLEMSPEEFDGRLKALDQNNIAEPKIRPLDGTSPGVEPLHSDNFVAKSIGKFQFGPCKDCPGQQSLMCCKSQHPVTPNDADRNLREWIFRRQPDLLSYGDTLDKLLAEHRRAKASMIERMRGITTVVKAVFPFICFEYIYCDGSVCELPTCSFCHSEGLARKNIAKATELKAELIRLFPDLQT